MADTTFEFCDSSALAELAYFTYPCITFFSFCFVTYVSLAIYLISFAKFAQAKL